MLLCWSMLRHVGQLKLSWDQVGSNLDLVGTSWFQVAARLGSIWDKFGVDLWTTRGRIGLGSEPTRWLQMAAGDALFQFGFFRSGHVSIKGPGPEQIRRLRRAFARSNRKYGVLGDRSRCHEVV